MNAPTAATRLSEEHRRYLRWIPVAVLPCVAVGVWRFGPQVLMQLAVAVIVGAVVAFGSDLLRRRKTPKSFWVPALLFVLVIPPGLPLWMTALGFAFALVVGQEIFGGPGCERFSVPMLGRLFLLLSYPALMTGPCVASFIGEDGMFFIATDPVISPQGNARFIYGGFIALVAVLLQKFGGGLEGVTVAILAANALTPLIGRQPSVSGEATDAATVKG